ncbi:Flagellum site-determining protein YlxH [wastewater metagenome]|uniref:Flagellum site-determining protein YlxH n=2 Tax=unclassified sequences TaxID=12908 RepID=A0A5B8R5J2_9ZZZZ|nr:MULTISPECIES: MinD/ParA family protein [Arhodomonas]QEA03736.1 flagellum site-determining protein YlxH [uncultured organism]
MSEPKPVKVVAVASGKGGVGKTNVSVNLASALAREGRGVMLFDADLGLANVDVLLGLSPKRNLAHVLDGEAGLEEVLLEGPEGIHIVPASSGTQRMAELSGAEHAGLIRSFSELAVDLDYLFVDTAAGISDSVMSFARAAREVLVVVCDEPSSLTDAYALIKVLNRDHGVQRFHMVANRVPGPREGQNLYGKLARVLDRFLDVTLEYLGAVPEDDRLRAAVQRQRAVVSMYPSCPSARAFQALAARLEQWPLPSRADGQLEFFVERVIRYGSRVREVSE